MALSSSFLSLESSHEEKCLLCNSSISVKDVSKSLSQKDWDNLKRLAKDWSCIEISPTHKYFAFCYVHTRIIDVNEAFGRTHKNCSIIFGTKIESFKKRYGETTSTERGNGDEEKDTEGSGNDFKYRKSQRETKRKKKVCFICDEVRDSDINPYHQAGIGRCEQEQSRKKIQARTEFFLAKPTYRFHEAAKRLHALQGGQSFDLFAIDIYYHKNCYIKYAINKPLSIEEEEQTTNNEKKEYVVSEFFRLVKWEVIGKKEAFLLHQLLSDFKSMCEENDIKPPLAHTVSLKRELVKHFKEEIDFFQNGKYVVVHSSLMNPCEYSVATLLGHGLRDQDHIGSFANFIKSKVKQEDRQAFGVLVAKATSLEEAFSFPITTVPLSIPTPDSTLTQSHQASFRNYLINKSKAVSSSFPLDGRWIIDGMAIFRCVKPKPTYRELLMSLNM